MIKVGNKELIIKEIKSNGPKTASELSKILNIGTQDAKTYIQRLHNELEVIDKDGHEFVYDIKGGTPDSFDLHEYKKHLKFLNDLFKGNLDHIMKSKKIVNFVIKNEKVFKRIEELI